MVGIDSSFDSMPDENYASSYSCSTYREASSPLHHNLSRVRLSVASQVLCRLLDVIHVEPKAAAGGSSRERVPPTWPSVRSGLGGVMIHQLHLEKFKGFRSLELATPELTALIGPNGTGKSSTFQALALLTQSLGRDHLESSGPTVLGDFSDFTYHPPQQSSGPLAPKTITFRLTFDAQIPCPGQTTTLIDYTVGFSPAGLAVHGVRIPNPDGSVLYEDALELDQGTRTKRIDFGTYSLDFQLARNVVGSPVHVSSSSGHVPPGRIDDWHAFWANFSVPLSEVYFVPAVRGFEVQAYQQLPSSPTEKDLTHFRTLSHRARAIITLFLHHPEIERKVSEWLSLVTERTAGRSGAPEFHWFVQTSDRGRSFNVIHDGAGTNQLIHLLTQVVLAPEGSTLCIDEPEIHLHPKAQSRLVALLVSIALSEKKQILFSTHSEYIVMGLATAVAEQKLKADQVSIYSFGRDDGEIIYEKLRLTDHGQIVGGLKDFFQAEVEQTQRFMSALAKERQ